MKKKYIVDTNVLMDDPNCLDILRNGIENEIYIPKTVIDELDNLKRNPNKKLQVIKITEQLLKHKDNIHILDTLNYSDSPDNKIIKEISSLNNRSDYTFVTNDKLFSLKTYKEGIITEDYKQSNPIKSEAETNTGFIDLYTEEGKIEDFNNYKNTFHFDEVGKLKFYSSKENKVVNVQDEEI